MSDKFSGYKFLIYLPLLILISVALLQIWLSYEKKLSPWSGGGFGMFSTTDAGGNRHLHAYAVTTGIRRELEIPVIFKKEVDNILTFPSDSNFIVLANELKNIPNPDEGPVTILIQIWKTSYNPGTLEPSTSMIKSMAVPIDEK